MAFALCNLGSRTLGRAARLALLVRKTSVTHVMTPVRAMAMHNLPPLSSKAPLRSAFAASGGAGGGGGGGGGGSEGGGGLWAGYLRLLDTNPLATKAVTTAFLNWLGDAICQLVIEKGDKFDFKRSAIFTFLGGVLVGPALHFWYSNLGRIITFGGAGGAVAKLALDQLVFSPAFIAVFISALFTLEGNSALVVGKLKADLSSTVVANWKIWVPFQFFNFRFVPPNLQVATANMIALLWNVYLSAVTHTPHSPPPPPPPPPPPAMKGGNKKK